MKFRGNLLTTNKNTKKKLELLRNITKDALSEGVSNVQDIDNKLNDVDDYSPSLFFPLNELNQPLLFFKEFQDALTEARSIENLASEYISVLVNLQEETYYGVRGLVNDWFSASERIRCVTNYEKYLHRSVGSTLSVLPISFFISPESPVESVFGRCYNTLNNQLTLPVKNRSLFPVRKVYFESYNDPKDNQLNHHVQLGSFMFRATSSIDKEDIKFKVELEQEEQCNHFRIPCCLPLPIYIQSIRLLDSADRQTRIFTRTDLEPLLKRVPVSLELFFPPTPVKRIEVIFKNKLDTRKIGVVEKIELSEIEANLSPIAAKNIELLNARGQIDRDEINNLLHDSFASFRTLLNKQKLNNVDAWCSVMGIVFEASLTEFKRSGDFSTKVYSGKDVKMSTVRADGKLMNHLGDFLSFQNNTDLPSTFINYKLVKSCLDDDNNLISRIFVPHLLSRPFNKRSVELLTAQDVQDRRAENIQNNQVYGLNFYTNQTVNLYTPSLSGPQSVTGIVDVNTNSLLTTVKMNNLLLEDVIAVYDADTTTNSNLANFSEQRPYFLSPTGSVLYRPSLENIEYCDMHLVLEMHRVEFNKYITPILDSATLVFGHKDNKGSDN